MLVAMSQPVDLIDVAERPRPEQDVEARAARGDRRALEQLLREHAGAVLSLSRALCGPSAARDVAQDALAKVVTNARMFDPSRGTFRQFALAVTRNVARDFGRRKKLENAAFMPDGEPYTDAAPAAAASPERDALNHGALRDLDAALGQMPEGMREVVVRFHLHEATYEEIASDLDVPIGTVMSWLHRARKRLRDAMGEADK